MKEIKEVVHVPTRELAEEVLRVAKENGFQEPCFELEHYLKITGEELCFGFNEAYFSFADKYSYKEEDYKIITAQEFLNRYKNSELDQLRKENEELKQQLKAIEDQPKVGDVCLFWDSNHKTFTCGKLINIKQGMSRPYVSIDKFVYSHCIKATNENIKSKIKELHNE